MTDPETPSPEATGCVAPAAVSDLDANPTVWKGLPGGRSPERAPGPAWGQGQGQADTDADTDAVVGMERDQPAHGPGGAFPPPSARHFPFRFGKFRLLQVVATGGMGVVYRAEELGEDGKRVRLVALKQILPERVCTPCAVERFQRERKTVKTLDHPNIVPVYESGEVGGEHYFTMPFVSGGSLQQFVADEARRLTPRQAVAVVRQVAEGIRYAHERGVVHRDIKPQNILLQVDARSSPEDPLSGSQLPFTARLTDFGLAKLLSEDTTLTLSQRGEAMGTPGYMPPEQAEGKTDLIGPAADVYGLGAVLYALLAGRPPFPLTPGASVLETIKQVVEAEPRRAQEVDPRLSGDLDDVCTKCLQKSPAARYQNAEQLIEALDDVLAGRPTIRHTPRRAGWLGRATRRLARSARRHPLVTGYLAASAAAIAVLAVLLLLPNSRVADQAAAADREGHRLHKASDTWGALKHFQEAQRGYEAALRESPALDRIVRPARQVELRLARAEVGCVQGGILRRERRRQAQADAETAFEEARRELEGLAGKAGLEEDRRLRLLAEVHHGLGALFGAQKPGSRLDEGLEHYRQAQDLRQDLCARHPANRDYLRDLARGYGFQGDLLLEQHKLEPAREAFAKAAKIRLTLLAETPESEPDRRTDAHCQHARDFLNVAAYHEQAGRPEQAREAYREQVAYYRAHLPGALPDECSTDRAECLVSLANLELDLGDWGTAGRRLLDEALSEYQALVANNKGTRVEDLQLWARVVHGKALVEEGKAEQARGELNAAVTQLRKGTRRPEDLFRQAIAQAWLARTVAQADQAVHHAFALQSLGDAAARGFDSLPKVQAERGFAPLRPRPEFEAVLRSLRQAP